MPSFRVEHTFECTQTTFWEKVFFDLEYNRRLFYDELHFAEWTELDRKDEGHRVTRSVRALPPLADLPGPLKAAIGESAGYEEYGVFERATNSYTAKVKATSLLGDRVAVELAFNTEPLPEDRCKRIVNGSVNVKAFMIGSLIEQRMISDLKRSYEKNAVFTNKFVAEKGWR
ncbi:MAG TPA: DUF2505 family protein [Polyangiaceae bacterium]